MGVVLLLPPPFRFGSAWRRGSGSHQWGSGECHRLLRRLRRLQLHGHNALRAHRPHLAKLSRDLIRPDFRIPETRAPKACQCPDRQTDGQTDRDKPNMGLRESRGPGVEGGGDKSNAFRERGLEVATGAF